jgi:uncharacterized protein YoxC
MKIVSLIVTLAVLLVLLWYYVSSINKTVSPLNTSDDNYLKNAEKAVEETNEVLRKQAEEIEKIRNK